VDWTDFESKFCGYYLIDYMGISSKLRKINLRTFRYRENIREFEDCTVIFGE
jgi:hypothetical protein